MHGHPALIGTRWTPDPQSQKIHDHAQFHPDHDGPHSSQGTARASRIAPALMACVPNLPVNRTCCPACFTVMYIFGPFYDSQPQ